MECPNCKLENPVGAYVCDCGYRFASRPKVANSVFVNQAPTVAPVVGKKIPTGPMLAAMLTLVALVWILAAMNSAPAINSSNVNPARTIPTPTATPVPTSPAKVTPVIPPPPSSPWSFSENEDSMGRKRSFATVLSNNTLAFAFPYTGAQHGTLTVRKSAVQGTNVIVRIEKGQFLCTSYEGCTVNVRFDEGPISHFSASPPSDNSTTSLFIGSEGTFISKLKKATVVRIEATFYQEGNQTLEFDVEGFK
jgi:hypothetical protein